MTPCPNHCQCPDHRATIALGTFGGWPHVPDANPNDDELLILLEERAEFWVAAGSRPDPQTWREYFLALFVLGVVSAALLAAVFVLWSLIW
jgi:hypothetical protein